MKNACIHSYRIGKSRHVTARFPNSGQYLPIIAKLSFVDFPSEQRLIMSSLLKCF